MDLNLPKGYLSFSSMQLWQSSKDQFRKKYYSTDPYVLETPYTLFGKAIGETLEDKEATAAHPVLSKIPSYDIPEYGIEVDIEGVPIKGFLDSFCPYSFSILEYKTGIRPASGKPAWNALKVKKHDQLPLYALMVQTLHGYVNPVTKLVWLETEWAEECEDTAFNNTTYQTCKPALRLTGDFKVFKREVKEWELLKMRQKIVRIAQEISADYTLYQQTNS